MISEKAMKNITCTILVEMIRQHRIASNLDQYLEDLEYGLIGMPVYDTKMIECKRIYRENYLKTMNVEMSESEKKMWEKLEYLASLEDL